jgi:hypothetical protein
MAVTKLFQHANSDNSDFPTAIELFKPSQKAVLLNVITLIEFLIIPIILSVLSALLFRQHTSVSATLRTSLNYSYSATSKHMTYPTGWYVANGVSIIVSLLFTPGLSYALLQGAKGSRVDFLPAFRVGLHFFWRYVGVVICSGLIIIGGFLLLIVPGFFMLRRYYLAPYYLIDRDLSVSETLRACGKESKQHSHAVWSVLGIQMLFVLFFIVPIVGWIVGGMATFLYYNAPAIRYGQISKTSGFKHSKVTASKKAA